MKKKFLAMYALAGALVASPVFTSCVDDSVSESVEALREANIKYKNAQTAQIEAQTAINQANAALEQEAKRISNEYNAAYNAYRQAEWEYENLRREYNNALQEKQDSINLENQKISLEQAQIRLEQQKIALEETKRNEAIAKAKAEIELEAAKLEAEKNLLNAQKEHLAAQKEMEKYIAGLEAAKKIEATKINGNIDAIMNGGAYWFKNEYGGWNNWYNYSDSYSQWNNYNSIVALNQGLVNENINLFYLQSALTSAKEFNAEQKLAAEESIAEAEALIKKYQELQAAGSNREAMEKAYIEAEENAEKLNNENIEKKAEIFTANQALNQHNNTMMENAIVKLANNGEYLTAAESEVYADTVTLLNGQVRVYERELAVVYEHTAEDAEELAEDIAEVEEAIAEIEEAIAETEANIAKVNGTNLEREAAIVKVDADAKLKEYEEVLASEAYKTEVAELEKAVADAQDAFDKNPTSFTKPKYNEDGSVKVDADGNQVIEYGTKELLEQAEQALRNVVEDKNYNYGTEDEPKWLRELYNELYNDYKYSSNLSGAFEDQYGNDVWSNIYGNGLIEYAENFAEAVENNKNGYKYLLEEDKNNLEDWNEELTELKEIQTILAADSEEMKEYAALCEENAELQKAVYALESDQLELEANLNYWNNLRNNLEGFVGNGEEWYEGSLPNYAKWIENLEESIKRIEKEIAEMEAVGTLSQEAAIAKKEAEIAAIEAELEVRQAEYDAEVAALKALVSATEE